MGLSDDLAPGQLQTSPNLRTMIERIRAQPPYLLSPDCKSVIFTGWLVSRDQNTALRLVGLRQDNPVPVSPLNDHVNHRLTKQ